MAKIGVLICEGCEIGSSIDTQALVSVARENGHVLFCQSVAHLCDGLGTAAARECRAAGVDTLVLGGCSPRFHPDMLASEGCRCERINLRELVVWSHPPNDEDTQMLAEDMLRMGLARASRIEAPEPQTMDVVRCLLIVGGGPTGLAAALGAARAGYSVVLVEKQPKLGGWLRTWQRTYPHRAPFRDVGQAELEPVLREVDQHPLIEVHLDTTISRIAGQPGAFTVELCVAGCPTDRRVGAIVQATGWKPYDATRLPHLGYGNSPDVVTNVEFERLLAEGKLLRPSDHRRIERLAFVLCAGSRDKKHLEYCSSVCCRATLKQALWARELDSELEVYVVGKDMRTLGRHEHFYRRAQEDPGIHFAKGQVRSVWCPDDQSLLLDADCEALGGPIALEADVVVLATGMVPVATDNAALRELSDIHRDLARGEGSIDGLRERADRLRAHEGTELLHLAYRQGPDVPLLRYGFPDSLFTCFPYETRRTGIYVAGCARAPNDVDACQIDGEGAALKAIQALELAAVGASVHPRWGDVSSPRFALTRCTQCKRCTEECPFASLDEDEKGTPKPNPGRCRRCGICLGACPERVVSFADYSIDVVSSMIKAVHVPDEFEEKPRILVLLCENDAYPALDLTGFHHQHHSSYIRTIPVRCLGSVNVVWLADALARGFDGILLIGCKSGEDTQCHFVRGSDLMATRSENIRQKLRQLALEEERVQVEHLALSDYRTLPTLINGFVQKIQDLGLNPFKEA